VTLGATSEKLKNKAWQVAGYYLLTGEKESFKGVTPFRPFDPSQGRWGAFELAARYSVLKVDEVAFPTFANPASSAQEAKAWAGGVNWYLNRGVKFVINYELTKFEGGAAAGEDREKEKAILGRTQIAF
jgi:phosphate-selective porin OprO/OprP